MKNILKNITDSLADAALLEMGVDVVYAPGNLRRAFRETLEEFLVEIAYAEAADYDQIHTAILREHKENERGHTDVCHYGDNDVCCAS